MWRNFLQALFLVAFIVLLLIAIKKKTTHMRKLCFVGAAISLAIGVCFPFLNLESVHIFSTPESIAQYACTGDVLGIVNGKTSSLIIYSERAGKYATMITPKTMNGYKIANALSERDVSRSAKDGYIMRVFTSTETTDHYVLVLGTGEGSNLSVEDTYGTEFVTQSETEFIAGKEYTSIVSFAFLSEYNESYEVTVREGRGTVNVG